MLPATKITNKDARHEVKNILTSKDKENAHQNEFMLRDAFILGLSSGLYSPEETRQMAAILAETSDENTGLALRYFS